MSEDKKIFQVEIAGNSRFQKWSDHIFLKDGKKRKISQKIISGGLFVVFIGILSLQFVNIMSPEAVENIESQIGIPVISGAVPTQGLPTYSRLQDLQAVNRVKSADSKKKGKTIVPRLKIISLDGKTKIPTGAEVPAVLISGGANGNLKAQITDNLSLGGELLIQKGSILYGKGISSEERLYVEFSKLIWPGGKEQAIRAQAYDQSDKIIGLKGKKVGDYAFKIALSSGLIFLGGLAEGLQDEAPSLSLEPRKKSMRDAALNGVATATAEQGRELLNKLNNQSQIEVKHSTPLLVIFEEGEFHESK